MATIEQQDRTIGMGPYLHLPVTTTEVPHEVLVYHQLLWRQSVTGSWRGLRREDHALGAWDSDERIAEMLRWVPIAFVGPVLVVGHEDPEATHPPFLPNHLAQCVRLDSRTAEALRASCRANLDVFASQVDHEDYAFWYPPGDASPWKTAREEELTTPKSIVDFAHRLPLTVAMKPLLDTLSRQLTVEYEELPLDYVEAIEFVRRRIASGGQEGLMVPLLSLHRDRLAEVTPQHLRKAFGICPVALAEDGKAIMAMPPSATDDQRLAAENALMGNLEAEWAELYEEPMDLGEIHFVTALSSEINQVNRADAMRRVAEEVAEQSRKGSENRSRRSTDSVVGQRYATEMQTAVVSRVKPNRTTTQPMDLAKYFMYLVILERGSDLHLEKLPSAGRVRMRSAGMLRTVWEGSPERLDQVIGVIKNWGEMDLETRSNLDGALAVRVDDSIRKFRISAMPTVRSGQQKLAMRLLPESSSADVYIGNLGMSMADQHILLSAVRQKQGVILVTGPTGSGKTRTVFSLLSEINREGTHIMTIEDPVEIELAGVNQSQVATGLRGQSIAGFLRTALRQDPDVILVGEMRDKETASLALEAASTGHLVLSTLHTTSAAATVPRITRELDVNANRLAETCILIQAQRLVRKLNPHSRIAYEPSVEELELLQEYGIESPGNGMLYNPSREGNQLVWDGRLSIQEILTIGDEQRDLIARNESSVAADLRASMRREGRPTLVSDGLSKVVRGLTSVSEIWPYVPISVRRQFSNLTSASPQS